MRQSKLFTKTRKEAPKDEVSKNAQLLIRAGFIHKEMAGVYTYLPLGLRVLKNIERIIREEMNSVGGQEMNLTALQDKVLWEKTGRWDDKVVNNWFKTQLQNGTEVGLGFSHEEPIANALVPFVNSYKDLPIYAYQIQTKFRNESRAKSGIMRGREFSMKDLYSFSKNKEEHDEFYKKMMNVYMIVFSRLGIGKNTYLTASSGEPFSKYSFEFQTVSDAGEDMIVIDEDNKIAINKDDFNETIVEDIPELKDFKNTKEEKSIEVGDIYSLGTKYSEAVGLSYKDEEGKENPVYMGSYGISPTRLMGTVVEVLSDENGIVWPESIAPFSVHIILLNSDDEEVLKAGNSMYERLTEAGVEVLFDDRGGVQAGNKFADSDLIGIPKRIVVSAKALDGGTFEVKDRQSGQVTQVKESDILSFTKG